MHMLQKPIGGSKDFCKFQPFSLWELTWRAGIASDCEGLSEEAAKRFCDCSWKPVRVQRTLLMLGGCH